jgi:pSer/pThr/pTyr-binding forkhead associated (FHA) protein
MLTLTLVIDGNAVVSYCLPIGIEPRLGRDPGANDIVLHDPTVSRTHARIESKSHGWQLTDFGSKKGTFVNGKRVEGFAHLVSQDIIEIGPYVLLVEFGPLIAPQIGGTASEKTQRLVLERCPRCAALALDFETCMRCGMPLAS